MDEQKDPVVIVSYVLVTAAAVAMVAYQIWAAERQHRETRRLLDGLDALRGRYVPRSEFDPAEQL